MASIFNYELVVQPRQMIYMPEGAELLSVVVKGGLPFLYARVDRHATPRQRILRTVCAGEEFNSEGTTFIDTFVIDDWFVGHLFEQALGHLDPISERYAEDYRELAKR